MTLNEKIEEGATTSCMGWGESVFKSGANFAIKAVIEMLEDHINEYDQHKDIRFFNGAVWECKNIIKLLKSEA